MAFKKDDEFLRLITMGAKGCAMLLDSLKLEHGHRMLELERYATANKIWVRKIKRVRLPDLLCLDCGARFEVKTKSELAIRTSHSDTVGREWDAGLRNEDLFVFVPWRKELDAPSPRHHFFTVAELRKGHRYVKEGPRKGAAEGFERDITWPALVPGKDGVVLDVDRKTGKAKTRLASGSSYTYAIKTGPPCLFVQPGDEFFAGEQFLGGCVKPTEDVSCRGTTWDFADDLDAESEIDRYVAVKAAGIDGTRRVIKKLAAIATGDEDERVQLEALGSLARLDSAQIPAVVEWTRQRIDGKAEEKKLGMEGVFVLSELKAEAEAATALAELAADEEIDTEIRSAAAWGLGESGVDRPDLALRFIADPEDQVALHAMAGIGPLSGRQLTLLRKMLSEGDDRAAVSAAAVLATQGTKALQVLLEIAANEDRPGLLARAALGHVAESDVRRAGKGDLPASIEAALAPRWVEGESWLGRQQPNGPLDIMRRQRERHLGDTARAA
jgi:hypothetical protein